MGSLPSQKRFTLSLEVTLGLGFGCLGSDLSPRDVDLFLQGEPDCIPCRPRSILGTLLEDSIVFNAALLAGGKEDDLIPGLDGPCLNRAGNDSSLISEIGEFVDILDRHPEGFINGKILLC